MCIRDRKVEAFRDYSAAKRVFYLTGETEEMDIPKCNCVYYELEGGSFVCVRPSGTCLLYTSRCV